MNYKLFVLVFVILAALIVTVSAEENGNIIDDIWKLIFGDNDEGAGEEGTDNPPVPLGEELDPIDENCFGGDCWTTNVVYTGATPIKDAAETKGTSVEKISVKGVAAKTEMEKLSYPYDISKSDKDKTTTVKIQKCRFDEKTRTMWYWIEATREGKEVAVDNPVWVYPAPTDVFVSDSIDDATKTYTVTVKEDPKEAIEIMLRDYVDRQPLGKAVVGTKE